MIAFINQHFVEEKNAVLQVGDLALQRGYASFDYLRSKNNILLFVDDYLNRFFNSAAMMHLQPKQTKEEIKNILYELNEKNKLAESGIRLILTGGYSFDSYMPAEPNLII